MNGRSANATRWAVIVARSLRGWSRARLARAAGLHEATVARFERGDRLRPNHEGALVEATGLSAESFAGLSAALERALRELAAERPRVRGAAGATAPHMAEFLERLVSRVEGVLASVEQPQREPSPALPQTADRGIAALAWDRLRNHPPEVRSCLVAEAREFQTWALAELVGEVSATTAADDAREALNLAELAVAIAERSVGPSSFLALVRSNTRAYLGNAYRVAGRVPAAEKAFRDAAALAKQSQGGDPFGLLDRARSLDLEASLKKHQGRPEEALLLLDQALSSCPAEQRGRLLLKKAVTLEQNGNPELAISALLEAVPHVDRADDSRLGLVLRFNLLVNLCHLSRFTEAADLLPEVRSQAEAAGRELDLLRVLWLEARIDAGFERLDEAAAKLATVKAEFVRHGIPFDAGLAALELAALALERDRPSEAREAARDLVTLFQSQGIEREVLASVRLFVEASRAERATATAARSLLQKLAKSPKP